MVGRADVHLVDEHDRRHLIAPQQLPERRGMPLHARRAAHDQHGAVEHLQRPLHLGGKIDVAGGIEQRQRAARQGQDGLLGKDRDAAAALRLEGTDEQIPTFDEVLALFESATPLIIELKTARGNHQALAKAVCERLDTYKGEFCIESFDPFALIDVKKLRPEICRGQLSMNFEKDKAGLPWYKRFIAGNLLLNFLTVPDFIAYKFEDRKGYCLRACVRTWGAQEVSWTIRKKEDLLACEADGSIPIFERFDPDEP